MLCHFFNFIERLHFHGIQATSFFLVRLQSNFFPLNWLNQSLYCGEFLVFIYPLMATKLLDKMISPIFYLSKL